MAGVIKSYSLPQISIPVTAITNGTTTTTLLADTKVEELLPPPSERVKRNTNLILNFLTEDNVTKKCQDLKNLIRKEYLPWFCQYVVIERVCVDLSLQSLLCNLLDLLATEEETKDLYTCVLRETYKSIKSFLKSDKSDTIFPDGTLLKNFDGAFLQRLGHWLGRITLMKNKPIILDDLDLRSLIIEAYRKGLEDLLYVIPLVTKIMEYCSNSSVFSPPCSWTMSILNLLKELYDEPGMESQLKNEIEALFKTLNIKIQDLQAPGLLKDDGGYKIHVFQLGYSSQGRSIEGLPHQPSSAAAMPQVLEDQAYKAREQEKMENGSYCDQEGNTTVMMNDQPEAISIQQHVQAGGAVSQQLAEDFSRNNKGFILPSAEDLLLIYDKLMSQMNSYLQGLMLFQSPASHHLAHFVKTFSENLLVTINFARESDSVISLATAIALLQQAVEGLVDGIAAFSRDPEIVQFRDIYVNVLKEVQKSNGFFQIWVNQQVTKRLIDSRPEVKGNLSVVDTLFRANLVDMMLFDCNLSNTMFGGKNSNSVQFAMKLIKMYLVDGMLSTVTANDLHLTVNMLSRLATSVLSCQHPLDPKIFRSHEKPNFAVDRSPTGIATMLSVLQPKVNQQAELKYTQVSKEKFEPLFCKWIELYVTQGSPTDSSQAFATFIQEFNGDEVLKSEDFFARFSSACVHVCVRQMYQGLQQAPGMTLERRRMYETIDALARLITLLFRHFGGLENFELKINLLHRFLAVLVARLFIEQDAQKENFNQLVFHRLLIMLFLDLSELEFEAIRVQVLIVFSTTLHSINPTRATRFVYAWLEIIEHRTFISRMLSVTGDQRCSSMYCTLLLDIIQFLQPYLKNTVLADPIATLYKGILRILIVILHDFEEFLCNHCDHLLDVIPSNCTQLRNIILSASPRGMRLPHPLSTKFEMPAMVGTGVHHIPEAVETATIAVKKVI